MHPAFSVIFLTTLIGAGQGLFMALVTGQVYSLANLLEPQDSVSFYAMGSLLAMILLGGGPWGAAGFGAKSFSPRSGGAGRAASPAAAWAVITALTAVTPSRADTAFSAAARNGSIAPPRPASTSSTKLTLPSVTLIDLT